MKKRCLGRRIDSLRAQQFDGELHVFVVDDNSSDATAEIARSRGATVLHAGPLPAGWTGKFWAVAEGVKAASGMTPDFLLLTDADIAHGPTSVRDLVARNLPLASVMVKLRCESFAERLLVPAFVFFFFKLYPPQWIADPAAKTAGAAGGCILVRPDVLQRIGGIEAIRGELIDDCALARAVKRHGPIWLGMTGATRSIRPYRTFRAIWDMVARTAFTQLQHSPLLLAGTVAGMFFTYLAPPIFTLAGCWVAAAAYALLCLAYVPMLRFLRPAAGNGGTAAGGRIVLPGRYDSLSNTVLAGRRRAVERPGSGPASINLDQFGRGSTAIDPALCAYMRYVRRGSNDAAIADRG